MNSSPTTTKARAGNSLIKRLAGAVAALCCAVGFSLPASAGAVGFLDGTTATRFTGVSRTLIGESSSPANNAVDPGETVTVSVVIKRADDDGTFENVKVDLVASDADGVKFVSGSQTAGTLGRNQSSAPLSFTYRNTKARGEVSRLTFRVHSRPSSRPSDQADDENGNIVFNVEKNSDDTYKNLSDSFIVGGIVNTPYSFANTAAITIRDKNDASDLTVPTEAGTYPSKITVANVPTPDLSSNDKHIYLYKATVTLNGLTHGFSPDVDALLVAPNGKAVKLISDSGFAAVSNVTLSFDDSASGYLPIEASSDVVATGTFKPSDFGANETADAAGFPDLAGITVASTSAGENKLTFLTGGLPVAETGATFNPNGDWKLYIVDDNAGNNGILAGGWNLTITAVQRVAVYNGLPVIAGNNLGQAVSGKTGDNALNEDTAAQQFDFYFQSVTPGVARSDIAITATSSDVTVVPNITVTDLAKLPDNGGFFIARDNGTGAASVKVTPVANANGTATITLTATSGGQSSTTSFQVQYKPVNDAPTVTPPGNQAQNVGTPTSPLPFTIADVETDPGLLVLTATSDTPSAVPDANIFLGGSGANRTIQVLPLSSSTSAAEVNITINAIDPQGSQGSATFKISFNTLAGFPTINPINNIAMDEDASKTVNIYIADKETAATSLTVATLVETALHGTGGAAVSDLIAVGVTGSGGTRVLNIVPKSNASGVAWVHVTVTDGDAHSSSADFQVTVNAVNDDPSIGSIPSQTIAEDSATGDIGFTVSDVETAAGSLTLSLTSSNGELIPGGAGNDFGSSTTTAGYHFGGSAGDRTVKVRPVANRFGKAILTVTVTDGGGKSKSASFEVTVTPVNDAPSALGVFTASSAGTEITDADAELVEGTSAGRLVMAEDAAERAVYVQAINPGPFETGQSLTVTATSDNTAVFSNPIPVDYSSPGATATVKLKPSGNATGVALITVTVTDNGGTANGGANTVTKKFKVNVKQVNDVPAVSDVATQFAGLGETITVPVTVSDVDNGATSITLNAPTSSDAAVIANGAIVVSGAGQTRFITMTTTTTAGSGLYRDVTITYNVTDSGQTENLFDGPSGAAQTSADKTFVVRVSNTKPNHRPHISIPVEADRSTSTDEDAVITVVNGAIKVDDNLDPITGEPRGNLNALVITAHSDNQDLINDVNIVPTAGADKENRGIIMIPNKDAHGTATVTVTVTDGGDADGQNKLSASVQIKVTVNPVPDAPIIILNGSPTISVAEDTNTSESSQQPASDTGSNLIEFVASDAETTPANLTFTITSSNTDVVPVGNVVVSGPLGSNGKTRTLTIKGAANKIGSSNVTVRVVDQDGQSAAFTVAVTVTAVNDAPTIDQPASVSYDQVTAATGRSIQLSGISFGGGSDENGQSFSTKKAEVIEGGAYITIADVNAAIGAVTDGKATLSFNQVANVFGTAKIRITLQDNGGGTDTTTKEFLVSVGQVNQAPTLAPLAPVSVNQGDQLGIVSLTVGDGPGETPAAQLIVTASADNKNLVPDSAIVLGGSDTTRSLRITPDANQFGTATVTVTVTDKGNASGTDVKSASRTFLLTVNQVQQRPVVSTIADFTIETTLEDIAAKRNAESDIKSFTVSDQETAAGSLTVTAVGSTDQAVIPLSNVQFGGSGGTRLMIVVAPYGQYGESTVTIRVTDADSPTAHSTDKSFKVKVIKPNNKPTITSIANQSIQKGSTTGPISVTVSDVETASGFLTLSATSSNTSLIPVANIAFGGSKNSRTVTATPLPDQTGTSTITVTVTDLDGGTASTTFTLEVKGVENTAPTITAIADVSTTGGPTSVIPFSVDDAQTAKGFLTVAGASSNETVIPNANIFFGGSAGNRTVFLLPATGKSGVATITITVTDGGGLTASSSFKVTVASGVTTKPNDFNGDGKADIILQDAGGYLGAWFMNGKSLVSATLLTPNNTGNTDWNVVSSGDFNGDGKTDLLFQHADSSLAVWYMDGVTLTSPIGTDPASPGAGWSAVGTGDFNADGKTDILFQNSNGDLAVWLMNGVSLTTPKLLTVSNPGAGWKAATVADLNNDGHPDIVFQNDNGTLAAWLLQGVDLLSATLLSPSDAGAGWKVVASLDLDGDGHSDLLFQNSNDGSVAAWLMNGINLISATLLDPANPGGTWEIAAP